MACDCEQKPAGAPDDSVRSAAALWVSAGKTAGFVEGVRYAVQALRQSIPVIMANAAKYERASTKTARLQPALEKLCSDLLEAVASREAESENLTRMATMMATRLDALRGAPRLSLGARVRAAAKALRG